MDISINFSNNTNSRTINLNFILIGILILAAFFRFYNIGFQGAWLDELHTLKEADPNLTFKELHEVIMWREGIPHFYFIMVRIFGVIFTHTLFSIRLSSVICGVFSVYGMYLLGKEMKDKNMGYIAAILLAIHPFHIEYSQEGRSYSLLILFVIFSFYRLVLFLDQYNLKNALYLGLFSGLITNAHPIGIVNILSVFFIIIICFFFIKGKMEKITYFKNTFICGITTLIVFFPVYQIVSKVSDIQSFWVQKPSFDYVIQVLTNLSGSTTIIFYLTILSLVFIVLHSVYLLTNINKNTFVKKDLINNLIVINWIVFFFLFILIKSLGETSIFLNRYLISLVPGFILAISLVIEYIKYKHIKILITFLISGIFLYVIFNEKKYYTTRVKAQFNDLTEEVIALNPNNETIVSNWGWLLSYYLDRENTIKNVYEKNLDNHINDIKTNSIEQESFWYLDGNSRPYVVLPETEEFLNNNFILDKKIELHDCWARHYISKKAKRTDEVLLKLNQFSNAQFDGSGNLMFFENSKSISPKLILESGNYKLEITAMSLPQDKINNENAKFKVYANSVLLGQVEASEQKLTTYNFDISADKINMFQIELEFINDFSNKNMDRNLQISKIHLKKIK